MMAVERFGLHYGVGEMDYVVSGSSEEEYPITTDPRSADIMHTSWRTRQIKLAQQSAVPCPTEPAEGYDGDHHIDKNANPD